MYAFTCAKKRQFRIIKITICINGIEVTENIEYTQIWCCAEVQVQNLKLIKALEMLILITFLSNLLNLHGTLGAKSKFLDRGSEQFVPKTRVLAIDHKSQEDELHDPVIPGHAWAERVYHIKTPLEEGSLVMYRFDLTGYSYAAGKPMDCLWVGYLYDSPVGPPLQAFNTCINPEGLEASTYIEGGYLHLKVGPISRFCNAFELFYQGHYQNATMGLEYGKYEIIAAMPRLGRRRRISQILWMSMHQNSATSNNSQQNTLSQMDFIPNPSNTQLNNSQRADIIFTPSNEPSNNLHQIGIIPGPTNSQLNDLRQTGSITNSNNSQLNNLRQTGIWLQSSIISSPSNTQLNNIQHTGIILNPTNSQLINFQQSGTIGNPSNSRLTNLHQSGTIGNPSNSRLSNLHQSGTIGNPSNSQLNTLHQSGTIGNPSNLQLSILYQSGTISNPSNSQLINLHQSTEWFSNKGHPFMINEKSHVIRVNVWPANIRQKLL